MTTVALRPTPAESAHPVNPVHRQQTRQAVPTVRNPALTAAAVPDCAVKVIPTATAVRQDIRQPIPGEVRLKRRPRPVLAVLLREPVTKPRRIPTATAARRDIRHPAVRHLRLRPAQPLKSAPAVRLPAPAISAKLALSQASVPATTL